MSSIYIVSLIVNLGFITLGLSYGIPKAIRYYKDYKNKREKQSIQRIHKIVVDYLNELKQDDTD